MPFHGAGQRARVRPPNDGVHTMADQLKDGEIAVMQFYGQERVWFIDSGENTGWWSANQSVADGVPRQITTPHYDPTHRIRGMSVAGADDDYDGKVVEFDLPETGGAIDRFGFGLIVPVWVTRVFLRNTFLNIGLNNATTATKINLYY